MLAMKVNIPPVAMKRSVILLCGLATLLGDCWEVVFLSTSTPFKNQHEPRIFTKLLQSDPEIREFADKKRFSTNGKAGQKIITRKEVKEFINQGWKFEQWLSNTNSPEDEAIISLPK